MNRELRDTPILSREVSREETDGSTPPPSPDPSVSSNSRGKRNWLLDIDESTLSRAGARSSPYPSKPRIPVRGGEPGKSIDVLEQVKK